MRKPRRLRQVVGGVLVAAVVLVLLGFLGAWLDRREVLRSNELPEVAYEAIVGDPALGLFALDPNKSEAQGGEPSFHGYRVLGERTVSSMSSREEVARDLRTRISSWRFVVASCFEPRHGVRAMYQGKQYDFVICFECGEVDFHPPEGDPSSHHFGRGSRPEPLTGMMKAQES